METKFVPGPWELDSAKIEPRGGDEARYQIIHGQLPKGINGDFGYPIADTMNRHHCISPEEDAANGRLIAAAPELYEALEHLCGLIQDCKNVYDNHAAAWIADQKSFQCAEAAINKAKGLKP
jgi:hypothetical protein